ncbi:MAG: bacterial Ig-like domain-containing protein [Bacilli bacterium]|nr:bacterial Ig-like domain-containing protein [Bacilli bacterium]
MKKILNLFLMAIAIFTLASCFVDGVSTTSFEIDGYPKTTYVLGETFDWTGFSVKINNVNNGEPMGKEAAAREGVEFPGSLDTTKAGTFTVKVTYKGLNASFQYTVLDSYFANGNGTATAPYQISTVEQFKVALKGNESKKTYYTLVNDIDFKGALEDRTAESHVTKNVEINGQGYALRGVNGALGYKLENSTFKNIDFHFGVDENGEFTYNARGAIFEYLHGEVTFENINTFGKIAFSTSNASIFGQIIVQKAGDRNIAVLKNCNNYASFTNLGTYGAVFTGGTCYEKNESGVNYDNRDNKNSVWYVLNCKNYGEYIAAYAGLINPNSNYLITFKAYYVIDANTKNLGNLISIAAKDNPELQNNSEVEKIYKSEYGIPEMVRFSSLLCAFPGEETKLSSIFEQFYKFDSAKGIIPANEVIKQEGGLDKFVALDYKNMAPVDLKGQEVLTYNFKVKNEANKISFEIEKGDASSVHHYVVSLTGVSTKHDKNGNPGVSSTNSTFATIECETLEELNKIGLYAPKDGNIFYSRPTGWTDEIMYPGYPKSKFGTIQNAGKKYNEWDSELLETKKVEGSECLYLCTKDGESVYVIKPVESNGYAIAHTLRFVTIVAYDENGQVCGGASLKTYE